MIKFECTETTGWEHAIRGMHIRLSNPLNSWMKSDSGWMFYGDPDKHLDELEADDYSYRIGLNDMILMKKLRNAGTDHRKFMRMITVYVDITAPLYWWEEFDTYKIGTVVNSCSTMHKIADKEFTPEDFSTEHLIASENDVYPNDICNFVAIDVEGHECRYTPLYFITMMCQMLNYYRDLYLHTKVKKYWWQMIQLLPSSYNQRRTIQMNYEVLANIYKSRKNHKLDEWHDFCKWIRELPYSELIIGEDNE